MKKNKKSNINLGIVIIILAFVFLFSEASFDGFFDWGSGSKNKRDNSNEYLDKILYINDTFLGQNNHKYQSYPNLEVGSIEEKNIVYELSSFKLFSNFFTSNTLDLKLAFDRDENVKKYLIYLNKDVKPKQDLIVKLNNKVYYRGKVENVDIPIVVVPQDFENSKEGNFTNSTQFFNDLTLELKKPLFFEIWNWNNFYVRDFKILEVSNKKSLDLKKFPLSLDLDNLDDLLIQITPNCKDSDKSSFLDIKFNDYNLGNTVFNCDSRDGVFELDVPEDIWEKNNLLEFKTNGYVKFSYRLDKKYFNDIFIYNFHIDDLDDYEEANLFYDGDKEFISVLINDYELDIQRNKMEDIWDYIEEGYNTIEFLSKPLYIEKFYVELEED